MAAIELQGGGGQDSVTGSEQEEDITVSGKWLGRWMRVNQVAPCSD